MFGGRRRICIPNEVTPRPARAFSIPPWKIASNSSVRLTVTSAIVGTLHPAVRTGGRSVTWVTLQRRTARRSRSSRLARIAVERARSPASSGYSVTSARTGPRPTGRRELQELLAVAAGEVGDRAQLPLAPEDLVRETRDVAHVDAGADDDAAGRERAQRGRHELADRREDDRRVERLGQLVRRPRPTRRRARARTPASRRRRRG